MGVTLLTSQDWHQCILTPAQGKNQHAQRPRDARATDMASAAPSDTAPTGPAPAREVVAIRELLGSTLLVKRDGSVTPTAPSVLDGKYIGARCRDGLLEGHAQCACRLHGAV